MTKQIETSLGTVTITCQVPARALDLPAQRATDVRWCCEMDVPNPRGGALWTLRWTQEEDALSGSGVRGSKKGSGAANRDLWAPKWRPIRETIASEIVPLVAAWITTEEAAAMRTEALAVALVFRRGGELEQMKDAVAAMESAQTAIDQIDAWLGEMQAMQ